MDKSPDKKQDNKDVPANEKTVFRSPSTASQKPALDEKTVFRSPSAPAPNEKTVFRSPTPPPIPPAVDDFTRIDTKPGAVAAAPQDATRFKAPAQPAAVANELATRFKNEASASTPENPQQKANKLLKNRFVLEEILGVGGMGVVYKAKDLLKVEAQDRDPYVAIKVLSDEFKTHPEAFISLQREARKAQHLANQHTVKVYDFDRDGDTVFMTMEFMVGAPLDQLLKQYHSTGLPRSDGWEVIRGVCIALINAHRENIVHSDLKPGNIFMTDNGVAKVFDFGIARAVANIDRNTGDTLDRTVFDAGSLGALTPAYASREMLLGEVPDTRDDIYALGCIAYEMLTGDHPFSRLPADEAFNKNLKPKRIVDIKKRQWKIIQSALEFKREDRVGSVEDFFKILDNQKRSPLKLILGFTVVAAIGGLSYQQFFVQKEAQFSQTEFRNEIEFRIRYDLLKENIARLMSSATFTPEWESDLYRELKNSAALFESEPDQWYRDTNEEIYQLYIAKIESSMQQEHMALAKTLLINGRRYGDNHYQLDQLDSAMALLISQQQKRAKALAIEQEKQREIERLAQIKRKREAQRKATVAQQKNSATQADKQRIDLYKLALSNVQEQLECASNNNALSQLNMRDFKIAIDKLRTLNRSSYRKAEPGFVGDLATCIRSVAKTNPPHATDLKRSALRIFKANAVLSAISIKAIDRCNASIAGLGSRGSRATCKDKLEGGDWGPSMVVIPASDRLKIFAIGKYEVSNSQMAGYCKETGKCNLPSGASANLPVTNLPAAIILDYANWLSTKSQKKYRLPSVAEWSYAAKSARYQLDSNRNCQMSARGIDKGKSLIKVTIGKQNSWGLVNYAGNAQEFANDTGRKLVAIGGSYHTAMEYCTEKTKTPHNGKADKFTGFRLVREIASNE